MPERFKVVLTMQGAIQVLDFTFFLPFNGRPDNSCMNHLQIIRLCHLTWVGDRGLCKVYPQHLHNSITVISAFLITIIIIIFRQS